MSKEIQESNEEESTSELEEPRKTYNCSIVTAQDLPFNICQYKAAHNSFDKGKLQDQMTFFKEIPGKGGCLCIELDLVQG